MKQLTLDLQTKKSPTLDSFMVGKNAELLQLMHQFNARSASEHFVYIWGAASVGKTHLLRALSTSQNARCARYIACDVNLDHHAAEDAFRYDPSITLYLLDNCEKLSGAEQSHAFNLFNQIRENKGFLISTGNTPPASLTLREDLRTRLGWGLIYQLHGLSDEEKMTSLAKLAQARGLMLSPGVLPYLITHFERDMRSLSAMLDALDQYSLETKRPVTLPLLRSLLNQQT